MITSVMPGRNCFAAQYTQAACEYSGDDLQARDGDFGIDLFLAQFTASGAGGILKAVLALKIIIGITVRAPLKMISQHVFDLQLTRLG